MNNFLVSIVVPVYNVENLLTRTIESILAQNHKNIEIILVDDGSSDNSGEICDGFALKDNRVRVFHNINSGAGAARKFGVEQAKGKWIMFVDGDDTIPDTTVSDLLRTNTGDYDIIIGTLNLNNKTVFVHKITGLLNRSEYLVALLLGNTSVGPVAKLYKKELFDIQWCCPKHITNNEDLLMLVAITTQINTVYINNDIVCYNYLYRENSASKSKGMNINAWLDLFDELRRVMGKEFEHNDVKRAFFNYRLRLLYTVAVFKGFVVYASSKRVYDLILEADSYVLSKQELKMLKTLKSVSKQKFLYRCYALKSSIRFVLNKFTS